MATLVTSGPGTRHEKESLNDYVARIDPAECPFYSNCSPKDVSAIKHEWTVQELEAVDGANAKSEGADSSDADGYVPDRIDNFLQLATKDGKVSGTYNRISTAAGERETNRQKLLKALSLRRDVERILTQNNAKKGTDPRELGGAPTYITNVSLGLTGTAPTGDGSDVVTPGTDRALDTIDYIDDAMEAAYNDGGNPTSIYMVPGLKRKFSKIPDANAAGAASTNEINQTNDAPLVLVGAVSAYLSDFGRLEVIPSRHMANKMILGIDPDHIAVGNTPGGSMAEADLAKVGDSDRFQIIWEGTLEMDAPKAHFAVHAVNPSL